MAKGSGSTRYVGSSQASASNSVGVSPSSSVSLENKIINAGFIKTSSGYNFNQNGTELVIKEYTTAQGEKRYNYNMYSGDNMSHGSLSVDELSKLTSKSPSELSTAISSYIKDSFNPSKVKNYEDIVALRKKYLGF